MALTNPLIQVRAESPLIIGLTANPTNGISESQPLSVTAIGNVEGTWSATIYRGATTPVAALSTVTGSEYQSLWVPPASYQLTGDHYVQVRLQASGSTATSSVSFSVYNFPLATTEVQYTNSAFTPISNPVAGQPFYIKIKIINQSSATISFAMFPVMVGDQYIGANGYGPLEPESSFTSYTRCDGFPAGGYEVHVFAWDKLLGGVPLADTTTRPLVVLP